MRICAFDRDREVVTQLLKEGIESKHLIPVIGSGFTAGTKTIMGSVPCVGDLTDKIIELLLQTTEFKNRRKEEFEGMGLFQIANAFWKELGKEDNKKILSRFHTYMEENFTGAKDLSIAKRHFLNLGWRYIYTLNYDDVIEQYMDINVIVPYAKQNKEYIERHACLFKLHGDAKKYIQTGDERYLILSKNQYMDSMKSNENYDMCRHLEADFAANNILFVGCGLNDELDLLFAAETRLQRKLELNSNNNEGVRIIYVMYRKGENADISLTEQLKLQDYGITDVIVIRQEEQMEEFYQLVADLYEAQTLIQNESQLERCKGIYFNYLDESAPSNLKYFFVNDMIKEENGEITLPSFYIDRKLGIKIIEELKATNSINPIHVVTGARLSGKSYLLLQLAQTLPPERTYYLATTINDEILEEMKQKENCYFLLEQGTLSMDQIKSLFGEVGKLQKRNIKMVLVVNMDDKDFLEFYAGKMFPRKTAVAFHKLDNKLVDEEIHAFNEKIAKLRLVDYKPQNTILDFLFRVEENLIQTSHKKILPQVRFLDSKNKEELKAMIVLAVENVIPLSLATRLRIDETLYDLSKRYGLTVQKDYLTSIETQVDYSRFKFVNNSSYWVLRCLSECARSVANHKAIADAYYALVEDFERMYVGDPRGFNNKVKQYYMLDTLQTFFSDSVTKGTLKLPNSIYERLHNKLYDHFQFLHQEAKCELRVARRKNESQDIIDTLQNAFGNIIRALDLGMRSHAQNIMYTLNHMKVTKALVLSNYLLIGKRNDKINETIDVYYEAFVEEQALLENDFLQKDDLKDINAFLNYILSNTCAVDMLTQDSKRKFGEIYEMRNGKHVTL